MDYAIMVSTQSERLGVEPQNRYHCVLFLNTSKINAFGRVTSAVSYKTIIIGGTSTTEKTITLLKNV